MKFRFWAASAVLYSLLCAADACAVEPPVLDPPPWPSVVPHCYDYDRDPASRMKGAYFKGLFVSASADNGGKANARYRVRRRFNVREKPVEAFVQGMGVYQYVFSVNGRRMIASRSTNDRSSRDSAYSADMLSVVKAGENVFEAEYVTPGTATGGVLCELFVRYRDGSFDRISSGSEFESSADGQHWEGVRLSRPPPNKSRYSRLPYVNYENPQKLAGGGPRQMQAKAGERIRLTYDFKGVPPQGEFSVRLRMNSGVPRDIWFEEIELGSGNVVPLPDGGWRLDVPYEMPLYFPTGRYRITLESNSIWCRDERMEAYVSMTAADAIPGYPAPVKAEMRQMNGRLCLTVDGRPLPCLWGAVPPRLRPDMTVRHGDMPISVVTVQNFHLAWHPKLGEYNFVHLDEMAERYRRDYPGAYFIWDMTVYPPFDFAKAFPDDMSKDDRGEIYSNGRFSWSYSSRRAMDELKEMVEKAIRHVESSPYANRVIGYRINSGQYTEWIGWSPKSMDRAKDFSGSCKDAFAKYVAERHPELASPHVPPVADRYALDGENCILWDQVRHANTIAYKEFDSWIIARDILELCGHAKNILCEFGGKKVVGTYYGYTHNMNWCGYHQYKAHFALREILENNHGRIDFLMSPQGYFRTRNFGDTCTDMKPFASMAAAGILPVIEDDSRTHNRISSRYSSSCCQTLTPEMTRSILIRNGSIQLCRNTVPCFYAISEGFDFTGPECAEAGRGLRATMEFLKDRTVRRNAEIAIVASERSVVALPEIRRNVKTGEKYRLYTKDGTSEVKESEAAAFHGEVFGLMHSRFARSGAPVDYLLAEDLKHRPGDYKLYVFLNLFKCDADTVEAVKRLRERGASMVWLYAPGYLNSQCLASMRELTGIEFGKTEAPAVAGVRMVEDGSFMGTPECKVSPLFYPLAPDKTFGTYEDGRPGLAGVKVGRSKNYFFGGWQFDQRFIRLMLRQAGVHMYCASDDPVEANDSLFTLHARTEGVKTVRLPRRATVVDVFARKIVARDVDSFSFRAKIHSSHLFYYGADGETFLMFLEKER